MTETDEPKCSVCSEPTGGLACNDCGVDICANCDVGEHLTTQCSACAE